MSLLSHFKERLKGYLVKGALIGTALVSLAASTAGLTGCQDGKTAEEYAQQHIPSMSSYFSGFGALDEQTKAYIDGVEYVLTEAPYASSMLEDKVGEHTKDKLIDQNNVDQIQDLDMDQLNNREEVAEGTNIVDPYNKLPPSIDSLAVLNDELYPVVAGNDELVYAFDLQNFKSLLEELKNRPYSDYLTVNLDNMGMFINSKIRTEDRYEYEQDIRQMNGTYLFGQYEKGNLLLKLDDESLGMLYPDRDKRDAMLEGIWFVPNWSYSPELAEKLGSESNHTVGYEAQKFNLEILQNIYDAVMYAKENPEFNVCGYNVKNSEHDWAIMDWNGWLRDRAHNSWANTVNAFRDIDDIISSDSGFGETWDMIKFIFGYARSSGLPSWSIDLYFGHEAYMISNLPVVYKAFGVPVAHANSTPSDGLKVQEFVVGGIPSNIMDEIRTDLSKYEIVYFGNYGVSLYSPKNPMIEDGAKELLSYLPRPDGKMLWSVKE